MAVPTGANEVAELRKRGIKPSAIVAFDGQRTGFDLAAHVFPVEGVRYDWKFLSGCEVHVVVAPGIDAEAVIRAIEAVCAPYLGVVDTKRKSLAYIVPGGKLWQVRRGSEQWKEWFA